MIFNIFLTSEVCGKPANALFSTLIQRSKLWLCAAIYGYHPPGRQIFAKEMWQQTSFDPNNIHFQIEALHQSLIDWPSILK